MSDHLSYLHTVQRVDSHDAHLPEEDSTLIHVTTCSVPILSIHTFRQFERLYRNMARTPQGATCALLVALFIFSWDQTLGLECLVCCIDDVFIERTNNHKALRRADIDFLTEKLNGRADIILRFFRMTNNGGTEGISETDSDSDLDDKKIVANANVEKDDVKFEMSGAAVTELKRPYKLDIQDNAWSGGNYTNSFNWTCFLPLPPRPELIDSLKEQQSRAARLPATSARAPNGSHDLKHDNNPTDNKKDSAVHTNINTNTEEPEEEIGLDIPLLPIRLKKDSNHHWKVLVWHGVHIHIYI